MAAIPSLNRWSQIACVCLGGYALFGGLISFAGWPTDSPRLTDWTNTGISTQPNTAIAITAAGAALILLKFGYRRISTALGAFIAFLGITVLLQYLTGVDLGIDRLFLFDRPWGRAGVLYPGRMGPPGAISWTLIGFTFVLASLPFASNHPDRYSRARIVVPILALVTAGIASLSLIGYLYGASALYAVPTVTAIALQTASFILAVSLGLVMIVPEHGPMRLLADDSSAGVLTRRILPALIVLPILVGFLRLTGERAGLYDSPFGSALRTLSEMGLFLMLLGWTATTIRRQVERSKQAEAALARKENQLQHVTDNAAVLVAQCNRDLQYTFVNKTCADFLGRPVEQIIGKSIADVLGPAAFQTARPFIDRVLQGERVEFEVETPADVGLRYMSAVYVPDHDVSGAVCGWIAAITDVTDRKRAEQELRESEARLAIELDDSRLLAQMSAELIHEDKVELLYERIIDAAVRVMRSQYASMQMLDTDQGKLKLLTARGFNQAAKSFWERVGVDSQSSCGSALSSGQRVIVPDIETCEFMRGTEDQVISRQAGIRAVQTTPLVSRSGKMLGMISTHWAEPHEPSERDLRLFDILARQAADLLERRMLELQREELLKREQESRQLAENANSLKDQFLATLSHELRNPLNVVLGYSELLLRTPEVTRSQSLHRMSEALKRNAQAQSQLINDLLDLSRLQMGKVSLNREPVLLASILKDAVETVGVEAKAKDLSVAVTVPDQLVFVEADPLRLQQVIWNLLNNAVKFTPTGGSIRIGLSVEHEDAVLFVEDTGQGIDPEFLPHVFEMFRQGDSSNIRRHGGLGIGLALVQQLVHMHGGVVDAHSDGLDQGARFRIRLPVCAIKEAPTTVTPETKVASLADLGILVVDDSEDTVEMLRQLLEISGAVVHTARSGREALEVVSENKFDVILSDVSMPGMDGFEFLSHLRALPEHQDVPVLALTGFGRPEDIERARTAGFFSHITKPFDLELLAATLQHLPRKTRLKD